MPQQYTVTKIILYPVCQGDTVEGRSIPIGATVTLKTIGKFFTTVISGNGEIATILTADFHSSTTRPLSLLIAECRKAYAKWDETEAELFRAITPFSNDPAQVLELIKQLPAASYARQQAISHLRILSSRQGV